MPWQPPWTAFIRWAENYWNHPYQRPWGDYPTSHWGPRSARLCAVADWLTNHWCHD